MTDSERLGLCPQRLARIRPALEKHVHEQGMAGAVTLLARHGDVVDTQCIGYLDREAGLPMREDALFRIYSMTKPVTCVALMMLYERGHFQLAEPVAKFLPAFADVLVHSDEGPVPPARPMTIRDLLTHTSGITYHFLENGPVEARYREQRVASDKPLAEFVDDIARQPLAFHPGTRWRYGFSQDVVARLVEVMSGQAFGDFLRDELFQPLGMVDTGFGVPADKRERFAAMYGSHDVLEPEVSVSAWFGDALAGRIRRLAGSDDSRELAADPPARGGHGLVSTVRDYLQFCRMLAGGGSLDGRRYLGRKTLSLMTANHIPGELLPYEIGGITTPGYGYGLGFRVMMDPAAAMLPGTAGEYGWSGAASTYFWIDPAEDFIGIQMAQFQPPGIHLLAPDFRVAAYQALL